MIFQHRKYFSSGRLQERGAALELADIAREDEGVYICVADNSVSDPVTAKIVLNVLCKWQRDYFALRSFF